VQRIVVGLVAVVIGLVIGRALVAGDGREQAVVLKAIDGDTLEVRIGTRTETVRVLSVNTPETHHPTKPVECFGAEAATYTAAQLTGAKVALEYDVESRDKYGRRLAYVWRNGRLFEEELLGKGYARLMVIAPNTAHARSLLRVELAARAARVGLWGACEER